MIYTQHTTRPALPSDYHDICRLQYDVAALHASMWPDVFKPVYGDECTVDDFNAILNNSSAIPLVAIVDTTIVGYLLGYLEICYETPVLHEREMIRVDILSVHPAYRRSQIGTALMSEIERYAALNGVFTIRLTVWGFNQDALAFYQKNSYSPLAYYMEKTISPIET